MTRHVMRVGSVSGRDLLKKRSWINMEIPERFVRSPKLDSIYMSHRFLFTDTVSTGIHISQFPMARDVMKVSSASRQDFWQATPSRHPRDPSHDILFDLRTLFLVRYSHFAISQCHQSLLVMKTGSRFGEAYLRQTVIHLDFCTVTSLI